MRIGINGLGRIGRCVLRALLKEKDLTLVALNNRSSLDTLCHLLKYDSVYGILQEKITPIEGGVEIGHRKIQVFHHQDPLEIPWGELNVELVVEATGKFRYSHSASKHLAAGAKQVLISAPGSDDIPMVVVGVNDDQTDLTAPLLSNASCTTNGLAPIVKVLDQHWGIQQGLINSIHAYTANQQLHDKSHKDLRRARAAAHSIIPTHTGAAEAIAKVFPHLAGKIDGIATRVPVINGSLVDLTVMLQQEVTTEEVNAALREAAQGPLAGVLGYTEDPIVSVDIIGDLHSCVVDAPLTHAYGAFVRVLGWYDNEAGYSQRLVDLIKKIQALKSCPQ